jgi:hypothetical protein
LSGFVGQRDDLSCGNLWFDGEFDDFRLFGSV